MQEFTFEDCYCRYDEARVVIGNSRIERAYALDGGALRAASILDKGLGREWAPGGAKRALFRLPGMGAEERFSSVTFEAGTDESARALRAVPLPHVDAQLRGVRRANYVPHLSRRPRRVNGKQRTRRSKFHVQRSKSRRRTA